MLTADVLIYCADDPDVNEAVNAFNNNARAGDDFKLLSWSRKTTASLQIISVETENDGHTAVSAQWKEQVVDILKFPLRMTRRSKMPLPAAVFCCTWVLILIRLQNE